MLIVDAQVHIWSAGPPTNPSHRQVNSYTAEECIRDMDAAGVNACLLHPPGWDPNSGKISEEAAKKYPNRFGILGNFPLDKPESRVFDRRLEEPAGHARVALRVYGTAPGQLDDRRHNGLAVAGGREGRHPGGADGLKLPAAGRPDRRAPPRPQAVARPLRAGARRQGRRRARQSAGVAGARQIQECRGQGDRRARQFEPRPIPIATSTNTPSRSSRRLGRSGPSGAPTSPACRARGSNA